MIFLEEARLVRIFGKPERLSTYIRNKSSIRSLSRLMCSRLRERLAKEGAEEKVGVFPTETEAAVGSFGDVFGHCG